MIIALRKYIKGPIFRGFLIVIFIALGGVFTVLQYYTSSVDGSRWVARVNGRDISFNDFVRAANLKQDYLSAIRAQYGEYAGMMMEMMGLSMDPKSLALDQLIQDELLNQAADTLGAQMDPETVQERLNNPLFIQQQLFGLLPMAVFNRDGSINYRLLKMYLTRVGLTVEDFNEQIEKVLKRRLVGDAVAAAVYVPGFELKHYFMQRNAAKRFSVLTFSYDAALKAEKKATVTDKELQDFFEQENTRAKRYWVPEKRGGMVWKFAPGSYGIEISDAKIADYYEDNKATQFILERTKIQVRQIIFKVEDEKDRQEKWELAEKTRQELISDPKRFAQVAKQLSEDKESAEKGGLIDFFARGEKDDRVFERAAFVLRNNDDISPVAQTKDGFAIVQRVDKKLASYKPLASVKKEIEDTLIKEKFKKQFAKGMRTFVNEHTGQENDIDLASFIVKRGGKSETIEPVLRNDTSWGQHLFKLKKDEYTFYVEGDTGIAVKLTDIQARHLPSFAGIKDTVLGDLHEGRAHKKIAAVLKEAKVLADGGSSFEEMKNKLGATSVEKTGWLSHGLKNKIEELTKKGMPIQSMLMMEIKGAVNTHTGDNNGRLVRLDEIETFDEKEFNEKKADLVKQLEQERIGNVSQSFVASLNRTATINSNESVLSPL